MTPAEFRASLKALSLTGLGFSALTGVHPTTVSRWGRDTPAVPTWVPRLLDAWQRCPEALNDARRDASTSVHTHP